MPNYSEGLNLLWKIASIEAQNLKHQEIDPVDLMLGLLKIVDIEPEKIIRNPKSEALEIINKEVTEIKEIFQESMLVPSKTRRRLRRECFFQVHNIAYKDGIIHRSDLSKRIFTKAERYLFPEEKNIRPFHILKALLEEENPELDRVLLLVSFPIGSVRREIEKKVSNPNGLKHPSLPSFTNHPSASESLVGHCRRAIGYIELSMFAEAEEELRNVSASEKDHPAVKRLLEDIRHKRV